jgi:hypothetical protein
VAAVLIAPRGLRGFAADRFGWVLLPVGYRYLSVRLSGLARKFVGGCIQAVGSLR